MTEKPHGTVDSESRRELAASIQVGSAAGKDEDGLPCRLEHLGNQPDENIEALFRREPRSGHHDGRAFWNAPVGAQTAPDVGVLGFSLVRSSAL